MARTPLSGLGSTESLIIRATTLVVITLMLAPIVAVVIMSFTASETTQFPPPGLSLRWYAVTWDMMFGPDADIVRMREALTTSLLVAALTAIVCVVAGVPAAYALTRIAFRGRSLIDDLIDLPLVFPAVVLGIALLIILSSLPFDIGLGRLVLAHAVIALPFMVRNVAAALRPLDSALEEAATTLGAPPWRVFSEVILPLCSSGIASGLMLVFVLSFNEFTITYFLATVDLYPLSMWLFQQSSTRLDPAVFAVSTLVILINAGVILLVDRFTGARPSST